MKDLEVFPRSIFKKHFNIWKLSHKSKKRWRIGPTRKKNIHLVCQMPANLLILFRLIYSCEIDISRCCGTCRANKLLSKLVSIELLHSINQVPQEDSTGLCQPTGAIKARWNAKLLSSSTAESKSAVCLLKSCYENKSDVPLLVGQREPTVSWYAAWYHVYHISCKHN